MKKIDFSTLKAIFVNCTLKKSPQESHTETLMKVSQRILEKENVAFETIRLIDEDVAVGIYPDMTEHGFEKDSWPEIFKKVMAADVLIIGTPSRLWLDW